MDHPRYASGVLPPPSIMPPEGYALPALRSLALPVPSRPTHFPAPPVPRPQWSANGHYGPMRPPSVQQLRPALPFQAGALDIPPLRNPTPRLPSISNISPPSYVFHGQIRDGITPTKPDMAAGSTYPAYDPIPRTAHPPPAPYITAYRPAYTQHPPMLPVQPYPPNYTYSASAVDGTGDRQQPPSKPNADPAYTMLKQGIYSTPLNPNAVWASPATTQYPPPHAVSVTISASLPATTAVNNNNNVEPLTKPSLVPIVAIPSVALNDPAKGDSIGHTFTMTANDVNGEDSYPAVEIKNSANVMQEILEHCNAIIQFATHYSQTLNSPAVSPGTSGCACSPSRNLIADMTARAVHVIRLLQALKTQSDAQAGAAADALAKKVLCFEQEDVSVLEQQGGNGVELDAPPRPMKRRRDGGPQDGPPHGSERPKYKKRSRAPPPKACTSCGATETPEWRKGPDGSRTLCNACGLHFAKLSKQRERNVGLDGIPLDPPIDIHMLRASSRLLSDGSANEYSRGNSAIRSGPPTALDTGTFPFSQPSFDPNASNPQVEGADNSWWTDRANAAFNSEQAYIASMLPSTVDSTAPESGHSLSQQPQQQFTFQVPAQGPDPRSQLPTGVGAWNSYEPSASQSHQFYDAR